MTKEEKHLWYDFLRGYDVKFYRQRVIGNYIADFYCPQAKLVIELDGSQHYLDNGIRNDNKRSDFLNSLGISVMRFSNLEISKQFHGVCEMIHNYVSVTVEKDSP